MATREKTSAAGSSRRWDSAGEPLAKTIYLRMTQSMIEGLDQMKEAEIRKLQYPVDRSDVLRKCIALGLAAWEREQQVSK